MSTIFESPSVYEHSTVPEKPSLGKCAGIFHGSGVPKGLSQVIVNESSPGGQAAGMPSTGSLSIFTTSPQQEASCSVHMCPRK